MRTTLLTERLTADDYKQIQDRLDRDGIWQAFHLFDLVGDKAIAAAKAEIVNRYPKWVKPVWVYVDCKRDRDLAA